MKCTKCGSTELKLKARGEQPVMEAPQAALVCTRCGAWVKWCPKDELAKYAEPTTAEKLLWLVENKWQVRKQHIGGGFITLDGFVREFKDVGTLHDAINAAYKWAKEENNDNLQADN